METLKNIGQKITSPLELAFSRERRIRWMDNRIDEHVRLELLDQNQAKILKDQVRERRMQSYLIDLAVITPACTIVTLPVQPLIFILFGDIRINAIVAASPITPGGLLRSTYVIGRGLVDIPEAIKDRSMKPIKSRLAGLPLAPWGWGPVGMMFTLPQMATYYPETAKFLYNYLKLKSSPC